MISVDLFSPGKIGAIEVANRIVMAPLTRSRAGQDGVHMSLAAQYYSQRATAGLIVTEATDISLQGHGYARTPGIFTDQQVHAWRLVTDAVHAAGGKIVNQLMHVGRLSHPSLQVDGGAPVAPSAIQAGGMIINEDGPIPPSMPRALRLDELPGVVDQYSRAAAKALEAGFDGVEIHMANSFLLDQFLRDSTNHRSDAYGGSPENRVRLPLEVAEAIGRIWGLDRVGVRLSPVKTAVGDTPVDSDPQTTFGYLVQKLDALGIAYIHCIEGTLPVGPLNVRFDFQALRRAFRGIYIANGGYDRTRAMAAVEAASVDMIAFGAAFIANPDLVDRMRHDAPLAVASPGIFYHGEGHGYVDFPTLGESQPARI
jgi:N-ethylmaleimide reductase